jgi:ABC-2 type transport system ATP-binding protein
VLLTTHYLEEAEALCSRIAMLKQGKVVALANTSELLKAASSNVLRFKIDSELPNDLKRKARITGRIVQFPAHNANEIEQYLAAVRQAGLVAEDIEIRKADLEDVFLDVMSGKTGGQFSDGRASEGKLAPPRGSALHEVKSVGVKYS